VIFVDENQLLGAAVVQIVVVAGRGCIRLVASDKSFIRDAARSAVSLPPVRMISPPPTGSRPRSRYRCLPSRRPTPGGDNVRRLAAGTCLDTVFDVVVDVNQVWKALNVGRRVQLAGDSKAVEGGSPSGGGSALRRRAAGDEGGAAELVIGADDGGRRRGRAGVVAAAAGGRVGTTGPSIGQ